jgi:class 3 adenylate cyclase
VDIVGSTKMSMALPPDKLSIMISSFSQEMLYVIEQFGGYALKFVGDVMWVLIVKRPFCTHDNRKSQYGLFKI